MNVFNVFFYITCPQRRKITEFTLIWFEALMSWVNMIFQVNSLSGGKSAKFALKRFQPFIKRFNMPLQVTWWGSGKIALFALEWFQPFMNSCCWKKNYKNCTDMVSILYELLMKCANMSFQPISYCGRIITILTLIRFWSFMKLLHSGVFRLWVLRKNDHTVCTDMVSTLYELHWSEFSAYQLLRKNKHNVCTDMVLILHGILQLVFFLGDLTDCEAE